LADETHSDVKLKIVYAFFPFTFSPAVVHVSLSTAFSSHDGPSYSYKAPESNHFGGGGYDAKPVIHESYGPPKSSQHESYGPPKANVAYLEPHHVYGTPDYNGMLFLLLSRYSPNQKTKT